MTTNELNPKKDGNINPFAKISATETKVLFCKFRTVTHPSLLDKMVSE
jgi:hypothetical protein